MKNNKKLVIALNGIATSGKDELVSQIRHKYDVSDFHISNISSVDNIYIIAKEQFGWDGVKDEKGRNLLSGLKDVSTIYNNGPFVDYTNKITNTNSNVYFVHIREVDEIDALRKWCMERPEIEFISLKVERETVVNRFTNNTGDVGATAKYDYTYTLKNDKSIADWGRTSQNWFSSVTTPIFGLPMSNAE